MASWAEKIREGDLTVKGARANPHQAHMMSKMVTVGRELGAKGPRGVAAIAGAIATSMQETGCTNLPDGLDDSAGLYQQRPSMGWGSYAQVTDPDYSIKTFYTRAGYLKQVMDGVAWYTASHNTQRSAYADKPRQWYGEGLKAARYFLKHGGGGGGGGGGGDGGGSTSVRRNVPYEFSRGSADKDENSWDAMGRLAEEVQWTRYMRAGVLWYVSQEWLKAQAPKFKLAEDSRGVLSIDFGFDTRRKAAEASMQVQAARYEILPGDAIELERLGPGDGIWIVASVRRGLASRIADVTLRRPLPKLDEPAQQTETVEVAGRPNRRNPDAGKGGESAGAAAMVKWAKSVLGTREGTARQQRWASDLGMSWTLPWCAIWVSFGMKHVANINPPGNPAYSGSFLDWGGGKRVSKSKLQPGDIVVFDWGDGGITDHVALYVGGGMVIGGNQSDNVTRVGFQSGSCVGAVRPKYRG